MRSKKAFLNLTTSITLQIVTAISGLVIPRLMIVTYGSAVNGIILSISQFLSYITLLEAGLGPVVIYALYKPLANKDNEVLNGIIAASDRFFKKLGIFFLVYMIILATFYPFMFLNEFDFEFVFWMVFILGISTFTQYYFAISFNLLLTADQKAYINMIIQIATIVLNTIIIIVLVKLQMSVTIVRLGSAFVFLLKPVMVRYYVLKHYKIDSKAKPNFEALSQRWSALSQHIAYVIHYNTDIVMLTIFCNIKEVSVYSVYSMIALSLVNIIQMISTSIRASLGNMIAKNENIALERNFSLLLFLNNSVTTIIFTTAVIMVMPFVSIYTYGVNDVNYIRFEFAIILFMSEAILCLRTPYSTLAMAFGHFKRTHNAAIIEASIKVVASLLLVKLYGLVGVALGTLGAMLFRYIHFIVYMKKGRMVNFSIKMTIIRLSLYILSSALTILIVYCFINLNVSTYLAWFSKATIVFAISLTITLAINSPAHKNEFNTMIGIMITLLKVGIIKRK